VLATPRLVRHPIKLHANLGDAVTKLTRPGSEFVFRFAPTPNGPLHLGHAYSAFVGYEMAQSVGGRFLLRIEDIDVVRAPQRHVDAIFDDLAWLGLTWETPVLQQSANVAAYQRASAKLKAEGLLYPCFATRSEVNGVIANAPNLRDPDGAPLFRAPVRRLSADEVARREAQGDHYCLRIDMARAKAVADQMLGGQPLLAREIDASGAVVTRVARPEVWGDAVIVRKDLPTSYHLAVVVDDAAQGVTHVTRGQDLYAATDLHRLLQVLLGLPEPIYHHHRLIMGPHGQKLSKSAGDRGFGQLRGEGERALDVRGRLNVVVPPLMRV
jgi:glutamyl-Q tRNA(Asp) synthetase